MPEQNLEAYLRELGTRISNHHAAGMEASRKDYRELVGLISRCEELNETDLAILIDACEVLGYDECRIAGDARDAAKMTALASTAEDLPRRRIELQMAQQAGDDPKQVAALFASVSQAEAAAHHLSLLRAANPHLL